MASTMHTPSASSATPASSHSLLARIRHALFRKLWLPKAVYEGLPYCYVIGGIGALLSALYLPGWTWILPYLVLLGAVSLHAGLAVLTLRWRFRRTQPDRPRAD